MRPDNFTKAPLYWHLPELSDIEDEIKKLRNCDFKIAYVHWGYEFINKPNIEQRQMAHWLVDIGIDIVIGMHPHVAQGSEIYKNKHIFYSLGNSVFNMSWEPTKYGLLVNVDLSEKIEKVWTEYTKIGSDCFPRLLKKFPRSSPELILTILCMRQLKTKYIFHKQESSRLSIQKQIARQY